LVFHVNVSVKNRKIAVFDGSSVTNFKMKFSLNEQDNGDECLAIDFLPEKSLVFVRHPFKYFNIIVLFIKLQKLYRLKMVLEI